MSKAPKFPGHRFQKPVLFGVTSIALYSVIIFATRPQDIRFSQFWSGYFADPEQLLAFTAATLVYYFGVILLIQALCFVPKHRRLAKCLLVLPGLACGALGLLWIAGLMICSFDLFHP